MSYWAVVTCFLIVSITGNLSFADARESVARSASRISSSLQSGALLAAEEQRFRHPYKSMMLMLGRLALLIQEDRTKEKTDIEIDPLIYTELPFEGGEVLVFR